MANTRIKSDVQVQTKIVLELNIREAEALHALTGYGADPLLKVIYQHLGEHYIKPYDKEARLILEEFRTGLPTRIHEIKNILETVDKLQSK